ncbi:hypothetical protein [Actinomadura sp. 6K520]|uniref:hypothetical protein n=1 Tax=Actinomadura sp. 6K520 TaxID=2530364 RepID=UPI00104BA10A|nr:hypothetical protein [Actinomadura sp. 6K520]TDE34039.1 hypothetical protein E1289_10490 [Actinomadura sp. 6K520]
MCVSMDLAEFSGTTLYAGRHRHRRRGLVEVLGYQNTPVNRADGPNAMLLHLPARAPMSPGSFLPVGSGDEGVLDRMVEAVSPAPAGAAAMAWMGAPAAAAAVQVFEHDVYTVLLAADATLIPEALARVAPHRRPRLDPALMEFYADCYPGHTLAVCCFDGADAHRAKPLLMWYEPADPDRIVVPAVDCHTGGPPRLDEPVATDHWVIFGGDGMPDGWGSPVAYPAGTSRSLRRYLPDRVAGRRFADPAAPNGDFAITLDDLREGDLDGIHRLRPAVRR